VDQGEVAEVVDRQLRLPALRGELPIRQHHHAGVGDDRVERALPGLAEGPDRAQVGEVEFGGGDRRELLGQGLGGRGGASRDDDLRARAGLGDSCPFRVQVVRGPASPTERLRNISHPTQSAPARSGGAGRR
jgi:hypothetical protein